MVATTRGTQIPATKWLLAALFACIVLPAAAGADSGLVDVRNLPRLDGAVEETAGTRPNKIMYSVSTALPQTTDAIKKLLAANGWVLYTRPAEQAGDSLMFKKGAQGLYVSFTQRLAKPGQSSVYYDASRINANLPFPDGATDVVFDENRPYLNCVTPQPVDATLDFFRKQLAASGWSPLTAADTAGHWPNARLDDKFENGERAYFSRGADDRQPPVMLSLQRRADGKTAIDIRVAPFALPQNLTLAHEMAGLPEPDHIKTFGGTGNADSNQRKLEGTVIADIPAVLAFYRRELAARNWKEETTGGVITADAVALGFSTAEETAALKLGRAYDLTTVSFVAQVKPAALAARAKAKKEADDKFFSDAQATAQKFIAADEVRRAAQAKNLSNAPVKASTDAAVPLPLQLPDDAGNIQFDAAEGRLEFDSTSTVKALATFYRDTLKAAGWKEEPSVINNPNMAVMEFAKAGKTLSLTAMQMGPKVNVSANGSGLVMANAAKGQPPAASAQPATAQNLEADADSALPVPKQHSMSSLAAGKIPGTETPFRRELTASIPADLGTVLEFYRRELGKLNWKEAADRSVIQPDQAQLAFASPDGPATLRLGRDNNETTVDLAQKIPAAAAKADVAPKPGQARLLLGNIGDREAVLTINKQTIKIAAGAGGPRAKGPTLDLPPGKYKYSVTVAGGPAHSDEIQVAADDAWGLMIAPDGGILPLHVY
jgi:hypothetical protein